LNDYLTSVGEKDNGKPLNISTDNSDGTELDSTDFIPEKLSLIKVMRNVKSQIPLRYPGRRQVRSWLQTC